MLVLENVPPPHAAQVRFDVALGVFACDPLAEDARNKIKPSHTYLYMMLSGLYVYAVSTDRWSQKLVLIVLMASRAGLDVACGQGALGLLQVQREGGRPVAIADYLNARPRLERK